MVSEGGNVGSESQKEMRSRSDPAAIPCASCLNYGKLQERENGRFVTCPHSGRFNPRNVSNMKAVMHRGFSGGIRCSKLAIFVWA